MRSIKLVTLFICGFSVFGSLTYASPSTKDLENNLNVCREEYKKLVNDTNIELKNLRRNAPSNFPEIYKNKQKELKKKADSCKQMKFILNYPKSLDDINFPDILEFGDIGNKTLDELEKLGFTKTYPNLPFWRKTENIPNGIKYIQVSFGLLTKKPSAVVIRFDDKSLYKKYRDNLVKKLNISGDFVTQSRTPTKKNSFNRNYISENFSISFADEVIGKAYSYIRFTKNQEEQLERSNFLRTNPDVALSFNGLLLGVSSIEDVRTKYAGKPIKERSLTDEDVAFDNNYPTVITCDGNCNGVPNETYSQYYFDETNTLCEINICGLPDNSKKFNNFTEVLREKYNLDKNSEYYNRITLDGVVYYVGTLSYKVNSIYVLKYSSNSSLTLKREFDRLKRKHKEKESIEDII